MESRITATELAKRLSDVLNRVRYRAESFVIERNGEAVAVLVPSGLKDRVTLGAFLEQLRDLPHPDEGFADDLEAIQASQPQAEMPVWPS